MMVTGIMAHSSLPLFSSSKTSLPTLEENVPAFTRRREAKVQTRCQIKEAWNDRELHTDSYKDVFKRGKIRQWAMDVERNMLNNSRPSTTKTPRSTNSRETSHNRDLTLGVPEEPGFRRIKIPKDVSESNYKPKIVSPKKSNVTWKATSPREKCHNGFIRNGQDCTRQEERLHSASTNHPRPSSSGQVQKQTLNHAQNDNERYTSSSSPELYIRSSSNRLLNVISIDDYMHRHKHQSWGSDTSSNPVSIEDIMNRSRTNSAYLSTKDKQSRQGSAQWRANQSQYQGNGQFLTVPNDAYTSNIPRSASLYGRLQSQSQHSAAHRAIDNIIGAREVTQSHSCKGLYKYEASCQDSFENPPESKRFQKLNRKLHKMIDREFFGPNRKVNQRRPSTRSVPSYNSKPGENVILSARKYISSPRVSEKKENEHKDNLFEMLMELDDKSNGTDVIKVKTEDNEATIKKI